MISSIVEISGLAKDFNRYAINYILEREYFYEKKEFDFEGLRLERYLVESYYVAKRIIQEARQNRDFLDSRYMFAQEMYDFYLLSSALMSVAEEKDNENLEFFCIERIDEALDKVYCISSGGIGKIGKPYC